MGGIGCPAAAYLASSGVGRIAVCDFDTVDETNLGRQVLYGPGHIGELKADVAAARLRKINPAIEVSAIAERLTGDALAKAVASVDVVLDGSDNFATRFEVSDACVAAARRLISGSAIRFEGQLAVFGPEYSVHRPATAACTKRRMSHSATAPGTVFLRRSPALSAR